MNELKRVKQMQHEMRKNPNFYVSNSLFMQQLVLIIHETDVY